MGATPIADRGIQRLDRLEEILPARNDAEVVKAMQVFGVLALLVPMPASPPAVGQRTQRPAALRHGGS